MVPIHRPAPARVAVLAALAALGVPAGGCTAGGSGEAVPEIHGTEPQVVVQDMPAWHARALIGTPRDDFAHVSIGHEIWTFGGMTGSRGTRLRSTEVYDTRTNTWRYGPRLPEGLASFEGAAVGDRVYLFGGLSMRSDPSDFAAVLDTSTGEWDRLPPLPHPRYAHDVEEVGGRVYVVGGEGASGPQAAVDVFDPRTGTWSQAPPMPRARSSLDLAAVGDVLYAAGGWLGSGPTRLVQTYDTSTGVWARSAPLPKPMSRGGAAAVDGKVYVSYHGWSYVYDVRRRTWARANPMTVPRHGLGYIAVGERIYGIAGCTEHPLRDVPYVDVLDVSEV